MKQFVYLFSILMFCSTKGQLKKQKDKLSIKEMCGCFEIQFDFSETFIPNFEEGYSPSKNYSTKALEWAHLLADDKNKISIQHILITGSSNNPYIIKHWRQDWIYQNTEFYNYDHNNKWIFNKKPKKEVKGQWTQKVFQVDDSPRYEGSGSWVHVDGKSYWESTASAPLPRREYSKRNDYNVTIRGNRHEITKTGWVHDQNNKKVIRMPGEKDIILAFEKGFNNYKKVDDEKCKAAAEWWKKHENKWGNVRDKWEEVYSRNQNLSLKKSVDKTPLFARLFSDEINEPKKINSLIELYIE